MDTNKNYEPTLVNGLYTSQSGINYSFLFFYEKKFFDYKYALDKRVWMNESWHHSIIYSFIYVVLIFCGQQWMKNREKYDLRKPLIAWNLILATFSIFGTLRVWPEFLYTLKTHGVEYSVCNNSYTHGVSGCWAWLFVLSKLPELFDTVFIVLRKQQLIFLHWYHHATVLIYCWYSCKDFSASGRWFVVMNYTIHAFMYTYYAFRALRFKIPKFINIAITTGQISQMIFGIYVNFTVYRVKQRGMPCETTYENVQVSFLMYASYFILFFHFFHSAYIKNSNKKLLSSNTQQQQTNGHANKHQNGVSNGYHKHQNGIKKHAE